LIVGAGPTGLALAAQLRSFGVPFRIVERSLDRTHESRALAVQARTLEILDGLGLADALVGRGSISTRVVIHLGARPVASATLAGIGAEDTRYPFILFISQAETERVLVDHLSGSGVVIERGVELVRLESLEQLVTCVLRHPGGREEHVRVDYLVGCDGAHSFVRREAGFSFEGGSYPQEFVLGDVEADGPLERGAINSFAGEGGAAMFFPLGSPATWRVIAIAAGARQGSPGADGPPEETLTLEELQSIVAIPTQGSVRVRDPIWLTHFRLHHRQISHYRQGRVFLAGDAAHIHSPVGGQGMNTGIQDAWNLGWKLALTLRGVAADRLLESYESERWPVGRFLLRYTDRVFSVFLRGMSGGRFASWARRVVIPQVLPRLFAPGRLRSAVFGFISELRIHYRRGPAITEGRPRLHRGARAGDRLPDAAVSVDGRRTSLHRAVVGPHLSLLLCGNPQAWEGAGLSELAERKAGVVKIHRLTTEPFPGALLDEGGALALLGVSDPAQFLVRPDGYIAFRCAGSDLHALSRYLTRWFPGTG
jgi:2-polyprenyl-6-methoxyphenol hydroxylase-like FAD-dependent oxidoreductase